MEVGKIALELMLVLAVAIIAGSILEKESIGEDLIPLDQCCRYKCDVNCAVGGFVNGTCVDKCLRNCIPISQAQCCRYKCYIACTSRGLINLECKNKCVKTCPPESPPAVYNAKPSGLLC